jgi:hypothetical protein
MEVTFSGTTYGGVTSNFPYYIIAIIDSVTIQVGLTIGGSAVLLNNSIGSMTLNYPSNTSYLGGSTSNMAVNLPIYFTGGVLASLVSGTTYYINDVLDSSNFTISDSLVTPTATATTVVTNAITLDTSDTLVPLNPIIFTGTSFGNIVAKTKYYISHIINSTSITLSSSVATTVATLTQDQGDLITVGDTTGFVIGNPIKFSGTTFGGIVNDKIYYVLYINNSTSLQISATSTALSITVTQTQTSVTINSTAYSNVLTTSGSTGNLAPLNPITFSGTSFGNINTTGTVYYVNRIYDPTRFSISGGIITGTATATAPTSNLITVGDTTGFTPGNPIIFGGVTFGNIISGTTYYVSAVNDGTSFTISQTPGGNTFNLQQGTGSVTVRTTTTNFTVQAQSGTMVGTSRTNASPVNLTAGTGQCIVRTTGTLLSLTTATGTMTGTSTTVKKTLTSDAGTMTGTFAVPLLGGVQQGTTYYVRTINKGTTNTFTITSTSGGSSDFALQTDSGSMKVGALGWDHINSGTPLVPSFDSTTVYSIEPRIVYSKPPFTTTSTTAISQAPGTTYTAIAWGKGNWVGLANADATLAVTTSGLSWTQQALPSSATWTSIAYGAGYWVIISSGGTGSGSKVLYSNSNLVTWKPSTLPSIGLWSKVAYGNGKFVAITSNSASCAYSINRGTTWNSGSGLSSTSWSSLTYGNGRFVAVATGGTTAAYSLDGIAWTVNTSALPRSTTWSSVAFGNGRFVAISSTSGTAAYSLDGISWSASLYNVAGTNIAYGNGTFIAVGDEATGPVNYITEDGIVWDTKNSIAGLGAIAYGISSAGLGRFISVSGVSTSAIITAGAKTKSRAVVTAGKITSINEWDPGSNYVDVPTTSIVDTNATKLASISPLKGNGVLANPTFYNRGSGYNTNTTTITINGDGYAEKFQTGLTLIATGLSRLPVAGDNFAITGDDTIYKVTDAIVLDGTTTPNILAKINVSPEITVGKSPSHDTAVSVRTKYSQVRLTNHDLLNIGYGNFEQSNYPSTPSTTVLSQENEAIDVNYGRVFYSSTDQDGNFRVGKLFAVEQATGIITLSASQFGLSGLNELKIGGVAVGSNSVIITQFSTDSTFVANSNSIVPTQKAIKSYLGAKLTQGGANTFTGQLIAGTILVGGPDRIGSTILEGNDGWHVKMKSKVNVRGVNDGNGGAAGAWDGDGMAMSFFMKSLITPKTDF